MLVIYTAIIGPSGDRLRPLPFPTTEGVSRAVAFLDEAARADIGQGVNFWGGWELRFPPETNEQSPRRQARRLKTLSHVVFPDADVTLWVDGCLLPLVPVERLAERYLDGSIDLATFRHEDRDCIYREAEACVRMRKDLPDVILAQMARYRADAFPPGLGLAETTAVLRRHTNEIAQFNFRWWKELSNGSHRDQLSFDYVAWKLGVRYRTLQGSRTDSPLFSWRPHLHSRVSRARSFRRRRDG